MTNQGTTIMPSHPFDFEIQSNLFSTQEMTAIFAEGQRFNRWLQFEAALSRTQAAMGIIPAAAALEITRRANLEQLDTERIRQGYQRSRNSLIPLLNELRRACTEGHGEYVHYGATTQDVLDTSQTLELRDTFGIIYRDIRRIEEILMGLATRHRSTPMIGRTHGQQATPITFGLKCAIWLSEIRRHIERIKHLMPRLLVGQLSGAVGSFAALGFDGREIAKRTLAELGLLASPLPWHNSRDNQAEAATLMAIIAATLEKMANEVFELGKTEVGEILEPAPPGKSSSTMPHKRNPVICQRVAVLSRQVRALSGTVIEAMIHEHERDGRALWSEWLAMPQISIYTGTALNYIISVFNGLEVAPERMLANLNLHGDLVLSEWLQFRLGASLGKMCAQEKLAGLIALVGREGITLREGLERDLELSAVLGPDDYTSLKHPEKHIGLSEAMVDDLLLDLTEQRNQEPKEL
ncbi:MAG: adenylosuccinate lyase family protein [Desulfobulbaceae bacterium]|nr:adenylosuccinate lyase family protein [Desulfobulbaceae bacterium]